MDRDLDRAILQLAQRQHGAFARWQARAAGASDRQIAARLAAGTWVVVTAGVYALAAIPASWLRSCSVALLAAGGASALWATTAAAVHELTGFRPGRVHVADPVRASRTAAAAVYHRSRDLQPADITTTANLRTTTIARTLVDVAAHDRVEAALDDALASRCVTYEQVASCFLRVARCGKPGTRRMRQLLEDRAPGGLVLTSELERRVYALLVEATGQRPECQVPAPWAPGEERVDFALLGGRVVVEADSRRWHSRLHDFERDRRRDRRAASVGVAVIRIAWEDVTMRRAEVIGDIRRILVTAAA